MGQEPQIKSIEDQVKETFSASMVVANIVALCFTMFTHCRFGCRAFAAAPLSFLFIWAYAGFADCPLIAWYSVPWMFATAFRKLTASRQEHSRYMGYPWVFGRMAGEYVARVAEILLVFFVGVFMEGPVPGSGMFFVIGAGAMMVVLCMEKTSLSARNLALRDAQIQARQMSAMNRGRSGW